MHFRDARDYATGSRGAAWADMAIWARQALRDPAYRASLRRRLLRGDTALEEIVWQLAFDTKLLHLADKDRVAEEPDQEEQDAEARQVFAAMTPQEKAEFCKLLDAQQMVWDTARARRDAARRADGGAEQGRTA